MPGIFFKRFDPDVITGTLFELALAENNFSNQNLTNFYQTLLVEDSNPAGIILTPHFEPPEIQKNEVVEKQSSDLTARNFRPIPVGRGPVTIY